MVTLAVDLSALLDSNNAIPTPIIAYMTKYWTFVGHFIISDITIATQRNKVPSPFRTEACFNTVFGLVCLFALVNVKMNVG
jgi:hypothetical protein